MLQQALTIATKEKAKELDDHLQNRQVELDNIEDQKKAFFNLKIQCEHMKKELVLTKDLLSCAEKALEMYARATKMRDEASVFHQNFLQKKKEVSDEKNCDNGHQMDEDD